MVRSRFAVQPESGGINGEPSKADPAAGEQIRRQVIEVLTAKLQAAIEDRG